MYPVLGCTDPTAFNFDPEANTDDDSCGVVVTGCTNPAAINYNPEANTDDGLCLYPVLGCIDTAAINVDPEANTDDGSCLYPTWEIFCDGSCETLPIDEYTFCDDTTAINYNPGAIINDGSCFYPDHIKDVTFKVAGVPDSAVPVKIKLKAGPDGEYEEHLMNDDDNDGTYTKTLSLYSA